MRDNFIYHDYFKTRHTLCCVLLRYVANLVSLKNNGKGNNQSQYTHKTHLTISLYSQWAEKHSVLKSLIISSKTQYQNICSSGVVGLSTSHISVCPFTPVTGDNYLAILSGCLAQISNKATFTRNTHHNTCLPPCSLPCTWVING